jgi:peptidoglycan/xylan/chitin deacetylase (PgdA/CDA1 family)
LDWEKIRGLASNGMEIAGHSATHAHLTELCDTALAREVGDSRDEIHRNTVGMVRWLAYPYGEHDARVRAASRDAGYLAGFTFEGGLAAACDDLFQLPRIPVAEADGVIGLAAKVALGEDLSTAIKRQTPAPLKAMPRKLLRRGA